MSYRSLCFLLVTLVTVLLTACGSPTPAPQTTTDAPPSATSAPEGAEGTATRPFTNSDGSEVLLPAAPQRVVTLTERDTDGALALGAPVVGVVNGRGSTEPARYLQPLLDGAVSVGAFSQPSPEAILNLDPDLILIGGLSPELEAQLPALREIAPVAITFARGDDWRASFMRTAEALGMTDKATAWLSDYDARLERLKAGLGENAGAAISIVRFNADGPVVMTPTSFGSLVATEAGLARPQAQLDIAGSHGAHSDTISQERLDVIDGDWIFVGYLNPDGAASLEATMAQPLVSALPAVQEGRISTVDGAVWTSLGGPLAAMRVLDDIDAALGDGTSGN